MYLKHGETKYKVAPPRLYRIWQDMKNRCRNPNIRSYKHYGGRGIDVNEEWKNSYSTFQSWALSNGYQDNLTINRIDNDGNYEPLNCEWITKADNNKKREMPRGENNHRAKLTKQDIVTIRNILRRGTRTPTQLGHDYEVSDTTIRNIRDRKVWNNV